MGTVRPKCSVWTHRNVQGPEIPRTSDTAVSDLTNRLITVTPITHYKSAARVSVSFIVQPQADSNALFNTQLALPARRRKVPVREDGARALPRDF